MAPADGSKHPQISPKFWLIGNDDRRITDALLHALQSLRLKQKQVTVFNDANSACAWREYREQTWMPAPWQKVPGSAMQMAPSPAR